MRYFEVNEPYYALIKAGTEEDAKDMYERYVSDVENEDIFYGQMTELTEDKAWELFSNPEIFEYNKREDELKEGFYKKENDILLIDWSLT